MTPAEAPLLSVRLITYQHEPYIAQAIEGVLSQRTRFPFELVIGEDASHDGTRLVCEQYQARWPEQIRLLPAAPNRGMAANHLVTLQACRGEYVALCDGDDYWIDTEKLQLQVDFLEQRRDCTLCFHDAYSEHVDGRRERWMKRPWRAGYGAEALFDEWLITTSSLVFRNPRLADYPRYMQIATHEDLALFVYLADQGAIGYLDRVMGVYRRHPGGVMNSFAGIAFADRQIAFLTEMDKWFAGKYRRPIHRRIAAQHRYIAKLLARAGQRWAAIKQLRCSMRYSKRPGLVWLADTAKILLLAALPERVRRAALSERVETEGAAESR
jgi:glycosyltransferase involved in cell wall biosynthesis